MIFIFTVFHLENPAGCRSFFKADTAADCFRANVLFGLFQLVLSPDGADGILIAVSIRHGGAWPVCIIPTFASPPHRQTLRPMNFAPMLLSIRRLSSKFPRPCSIPSIVMARERYFSSTSRDIVRSKCHALTAPLKSWGLGVIRNQKEKGFKQSAAPARLLRTGL